MQFRKVMAMSVLGACCAGLLFAQEKPAANGRPVQIAQKTKEKAAKTEAKKPTNRLPNNFGKLNLNDAQRDTIYAIQTKHNTQIDALEEQVKALKAKRDAEIHAVLTAEQQEKLAGLELDAKKKKTEKADKEKKEAAADSEAKEE